MGLPKQLNQQELALWLRNNAIERVSEEVKTYYTEEQTDTFKEEVIEAQKEIRKLYALKKDFVSHIEGGYQSDDDQLFKEFSIPETQGMKALKAVVEHNSDCLNRGYEIDITDLFAVPDEDNEEIAFYDIHGQEYKDRRRPMSAREIQKYVGLFAKENRQAI